MLENIFRLDGKIVVITGAAGLLGRKHAEAIACYGGTPILLDLSEDKVNQLAAELNIKYNVNSMGFAVDITNEEAVKKNSKYVLKTFSRIDGLVNNAANNPQVGESKGTNFSRLEDFPIEAWNSDILVGLTGAFICAKHYGHLISKNTYGGSIVNISSDLGIIAPDQRLYAKPGLTEEMQPVKPITYSIVKTGLIGLTRYLSTYWAEKNIRCNAICPGGVENGQPNDFLLEVSARIPMNRMAKSNEYQGILIWMLSDASSYLNGAIIPIDGGRVVL